MGFAGGFGFPSQLISSTGEINSNANVGIGTGQLAQGKVAAINNLRTLLQGANVTITTAGNEVTISCPGTMNDELVKVSAADTTSGYLNAKVNAAAPLTKAIGSPAGNETLDLGINVGTGAGTVAAGDDSRFPTAGEKAALAGTDGTPGAGNPYVTNSDSRNSDARTPTSHAASHQNAGGDEVATATPAANAIPKALGSGKLAAGWIGAPGLDIAICPTNYDANFSNYRTQSVAGAGSWRFTFRSPLDIADISEIYLVAAPIATFTAEDIDLTASYGADGEDIDTHTGSDTTSTYSGVANQFFKLPLKSLFSSLSAGDNCGVLVNHNGIGTTIHYFNLVIVPT